MTVSAGVMMMANSGVSGMSRTLVWAGMPSTWRRLELTAWTTPPKGLLMRFQKRVRPTLAGRSDAPITATERGTKNTSSGCRGVSSPEAP